MQLTNEDIQKLLNSTTKELGFVIKLCEQCNHYSSVKHQNEWCSSCGGKMLERPKMTFKQIIKIGSKKGSGLYNTFYHKIAEIYGDTNENDTDYYQKYSKGFDLMMKNQSWINKILKKELKK